METPAEPATHAHHDIDWDDGDAHHHPVTLVRRPVSEGWVLTLFGLILVELIGLLGWMGYALSTVKAELRQVHAHVRQLHASVAPREPQSTSGETVPKETARQLHEMDQRLHAVESWTQDTAPRLTTLEQRPREKVAKPPPPSPLPALPPATQLPRTATSGPRTP